MDGPLIAIVGSYKPDREKELGLRNLDHTAEASEDLGRELAKQGYRIVVYTANPYSMELDLVRGYVSQKDVAPGSIRVLYSQKNGQQPHFVEEAANEDKFDFRPDFNPDWEFSFYQSLSDVDGMLILGGGPSGLVAGLVIIGHRKPVVACAAFGAAGEKIWSALRAQNYALTEADLAVMAQDRWSPAQATRLVDLLRKQREEFARREQEQKDHEEQRIQAARQQELQENSRINWHAVVSALLFGAAAAAWPLAVAVSERTGPVGAIAIALVTPMIAGASGASIRVVLDWAVGVTRTFALSTYNQSILLRYAALGLVAGGLAGVSFVLAQLFANNTAPDNLPGQLSRLAPFLVIIGFAAGLAAEVVLTNLRKSPPTIDIPGIKAKSPTE